MNLQDTIAYLERQLHETQAHAAAIEDALTPLRKIAGGTGATPRGRVTRQKRKSRPIGKRTNERTSKPRATAGEGLAEPP